MQIANLVRALIIAIPIALIAVAVQQRDIQAAIDPQQFPLLATIVVAALITVLLTDLTAGLTSGSARREAGTVKWFNVRKGYGFITRDQGDDVFVHFRNIKGGNRRAIREGQRVEFIITQGEKGLQADDVNPLD